MSEKVSLYANGDVDGGDKSVWGLGLHPIVDVSMFSCSAREYM